MNRPANCCVVTSTSSPPRWTVTFVLLLLALLTHLTESTVDRWSSVTTATADSIDILGELAPVRLNLTGVNITSGPYGRSPALHFTGERRSVRLLETSYDKVMTLLQSHHDITFMAAVRQEPSNIGTLFSLSEGFTRFLELQSSGRKDEIRLHYMHQGVPQVETFNHRLADGMWHRLAITVSGGLASLYVDCQRIERRLMSAMPDTSIPVTEEQESAGPGGIPKMSLWIGQRGDDHFLFKGAMQDVRLVAGSNGHLMQCPKAEAECPTCGEFHSLQSVVARLELSLQQLTNKLEDAEERLSQLEQCDCTRSCSVDGVDHEDGSSWESGCEVCTCKKGQVSCGPLQCPATNCSNPVLLPGDCCKTCLRTCLFTGINYEHGDQVTPRHCLECQCLNGSMTCRRLDPATHCPPLSCPDSQQFTVAGECCKQCAGVDYCGAGHQCHARAQCINLQTTYACHCLPGYTGDGKNCTDIDECSTEGGPDGHLCAPDAICVNTPGSYRCDCPTGYIHPPGPPFDNYTCVELDECAEGLHECHPKWASCLNTPGGYQCRCHEGYQGDGFSCEPVCDPPCQNGGLCVAPGRCSCRRGFHGPHCELDIDECSTGQSECHPNSECRNMPGWYFCACKPGFRSPWPDTHHGSLCQDVDECAEGTHSCYGNTECLNTAGSYECRCPPSNPNCSLACITVEGIHQNGETWKSHKNPCVSCQCREGVVSCSRPPCPASCPSSSSNSSKHNATDPSCCPQCRNSFGRTSSASSRNRQCRHQGLANVTFDSGQRWIYQCQSCECLHGETDCWPMECPPVYCSHPVRQPGDCCPRCPENDPCSVTVDHHDVDDSQPGDRGCHYQGLNYTQGAEWTTGLDGCTTCRCKSGQVCCRLDASCPYLHVVGNVQQQVLGTPSLRIRREATGRQLESEDERIVQTRSSAADNTDSRRRFNNRRLLHTTQLVPKGHRNRIARRMLVPP